MRRGEHGGIFFRLLSLLLFLGFLALLYVARHPLMRLAGQFWVVDEPAAQSDALIVLGDDNYAADRAFHAAELYREGIAPVVVASGRMLRQNVSMADVMERDLESFGVPAASIVKLTHRSENTREEAVEAARLIQTRGWKRVLVVTSNYHARRARFIYRRVLPSSVSLRVSGARDSEFDPSRWWQTRLGQKRFMSELAGYLVARWELRSKPAPQNETAFVISRARSCWPGAGRQAPRDSRFPLPYRIGNTPGLRGSPSEPAHTIVRKIPSSPGCICRSLVATEFSVGGKTCGVNLKIQDRRRLPPKFQHRGREWSQSCEAWRG
ncbi:MAG: YdcF family protein [Candidatus Acidiferrales bacterium]